MGDHAAHADGVDADARRAGAATRAGHDLGPRRVVRPLRRRRGHPLGGGDGRARRGVGLAVVVELDDLGGVEVGRRRLGEAHHQHGRQREVGGDDAVGPAVAELLGERRQVVVGEAGGPDDGVDAVHRQPRDGAPGRRCHREVDDDLTAGVGERPRLGGDRDPDDLAAGGTRIDGGDQLELGVDGDRLADGGAHAPSGAADSDTHASESRSPIESC